MRRETLLGKPSERVNCSVRCTPEWSEWAFDGAHHCGKTMSALIEVAISEYLTRHGYLIPAPARIPFPPPTYRPPDFT